mmetsp:Transcript_29806/g.86483  ORF Transcript_29806/g.86483 Transcript_29806/m.86483 type:complete len:395 (+) Transcript_29806:1-1185(+)
MDIDDGRHTPNVFDDASSPEGCEVELRRAMVASLKRVCGAGHSKPSVYTGAGGVCWMMLHLAKRGLAGEQAAVVESVREALRRLRSDEGKFDPKRLTLLEGVGGSLALQAWAHTALKDSASATACCDRLAEVSRRVLVTPAGECEVLYGRCGFLGAVLFARKVLDSPDMLTQEVVAVAKQVLEEGRHRATRKWPLYFEWHDKCYFGGAHGIAGILLTLLQLQPHELTDDARELIRATADALIAKRFDSGNLPSSEGSKDRLVHWCHGATGLVPLLVKLASVFSEARYLEIAKEAGEVVWLRGLLSTKGVGLCHGTPGNGYALLVLYRATGDAMWLRRAQHFGIFVARHQADLIDLADRPFSLFEGLAGAVCFWADLLHAMAGHEDDVRFPCYEF